VTRPQRAPRAARSEADADASRELAELAGHEALNHKGRDVVLLDLRALTPATDWFVLASGESDVQVRAIAERIEERLRRDRAVKPWHIEGLQHARWVLLDYVDFVVHVFHREARGYYQLERLWADAPSASLDEVGQV
jgi:ribosome-associated protein